MAKAFFHNNVSIVWEPEEVVDRRISGEVWFWSKGNQIKHMQGHGLFCDDMAMQTYKIPHSKRQRNNNRRLLFKAVRERIFNNHKHFPSQ